MKILGLHGDVIYISCRNDCSDCQLLQLVCSLRKLRHVQWSRQSSCACIKGWFTVLFHCHVKMWDCSEEEGPADFIAARAYFKVEIT